MAATEDAYNRAATAVEKNLVLLQGFAEESRTAAEDAIGALAAYQPNFMTPPVPSAPQIETPEIVASTRPLPEAPQFVTPTPPDIGLPPAELILDASDIDI